MRQLTRIFAAMQPTVFLGSAALVVAFVVLGVGWPDVAQRTFAPIQSGIVAHFGWLYVFGATAMLVFVLWLLFSRYRDIRLGGEEAEPEFGYLAWFAMMFSAGMGVGLVYWGGVPSRCCTGRSHRFQPVPAPTRCARRCV